MRWILALVVGIIIGGVAVRFLVKKEGRGLNAYNRRRQEKEEKAKDEILKMMKSRENITNDDVQGLLNVSDATATNYLDELEDEGKIEQIGREGPVCTLPV